MNEIKLDVQVRQAIGSQKVKKLRRINAIPGVVYGEEKKPTTVQVDRKTYERIMREHHGHNVLFHINILEGEKKLRDYSAIIKEEQHDPVSDQLIHVDFQRISLTKEITVKVQIVLRGEAVGVKQDGGSLDQPLHDLDVICLPTKIPEGIEVNVTNLKIGDALHVKDLVLPEGVRTKHDKDSIVVSVVRPMSEEELAAPAEATEVEVTKEKKKVEEPGAEGAKAADAKKPEAKAEPKKEGK